MSKYPYIQFYTGDWMKDPQLSLCSPATRGIWIDMLCAMHENDREGIIHGTVTQLSRLCRCNEQEMTAAVNELNSTKTAHVTFCNNDVTVENRRMKREYNERKATNIRVKRHRAKEATGVERECNAPETVHISSSSSISVSKDTNTIPPNPLKGESGRVVYSPEFLLFWKEYPRRIGKEAAYRAWKKISKKYPGTNTADIIAAIINQVKNNHFTSKKDGEDYIPNPATWLNQARWQDEIKQSTIIPFSERKGAERILT